MFYSLKVISSAKFMYNHLKANGYTIGAEVLLSHDLGDHVSSYLFWGEVSLLPIKGEDLEQAFLAESLADLARDFVLKGIVTERLLLYGNTNGTTMSELSYEWYVSLMRQKAHSKLLEALKWWYRQI